LVRIGTVAVLLGLLLIVLTALNRDQTFGIVLVVLGGIVMVLGVVVVAAGVRSDANGRTRA